jgi:hypothetical protein
MPEKHLFEYAVIRLVPRVEREEFLNVGLVMYCKKQRYLQTVFHLDKERLKAFSPALDTKELEACLTAFEKVSRGSNDGGPIARLDLPSRFRWLTATRSTVVQVSKTHPGLCDDLEKTKQRLFEELVL